MRKTPLGIHAIPALLVKSAGVSLAVALIPMPNLRSHTATTNGRRTKLIALHRDGWWGADAGAVLRTHFGRPGTLYDKPGLTLYLRFVLALCSDENLIVARDGHSRSSDNLDASDPSSPVSARPSSLTYSGILSTLTRLCPCPDFPLDDMATASVFGGCLKMGPETYGRFSSERRQSANPSAPSTRHAIFLKVAFIREYSCCATVKGRGSASPNKEVKISLPLTTVYLTLIRALSSMNRDDEYPRASEL